MLGEAGRPNAIGGFFALELSPGPKPPVSLLDLWVSDIRSHLYFHNARSAVHFLLDELAVKAVWLPAYICPEMSRATAAGTREVKYYPLADGLTPEVGFLRQHLLPGEAVVGVDYFGRSPAREFIEFVQSRRDVLWIEDRAQAIRSGGAPWGDYVFYSPRKVAGVPDGGILVGVSRDLPSFTPQAHKDFSFILPALYRFEHPGEDWHAIYQKIEEAMKVSLLGMSRLSLMMLDRLDAQDIQKARRANFAYLRRQLGEYYLFKDMDDSDFVPFGFPMRHAEAGSLCEALRKRRIYVPRHWARLPSPAEQFLNEHKLAGELMTLPCDQRYSLADMAFMVDAILEHLKPS